MTDFTRTKEDVVHECGILPSDFIHAGAKDKLTMLACLTPEQAFRLGHVIGMGRGMQNGYTAASQMAGRYERDIEIKGLEAIDAFNGNWHIKERK